MTSSQPRPETINELRYGPGSSLAMVAGVQLDLFTLLKERTANAGYPTEFYLIEVTFQTTEDEAERAYLNSLPTSLSLPDEDVDRLRKAARQLLRTNPEFQRGLQDLAR